MKYSNYLFAGAIPVWIVNLQAAALRGSGNVRVPAAVTLVGALVMIPTSPILIFGFGPIPRLGIGGAGIAFAVYYCAAMLVLLRYMASGRAGLTFKVVPLRGRLFADILKVGIPTAINTVLTNLTVILVTGAVGLFGTGALAAYGIASRLDYIMIPLLFGVSTAVLTMVGVNIGAGDVARARKIGWTGGLVGLALTGTIGLTVAGFPLVWMHLFSHDPEVVSEGTTYLRIVAPAYGALGFGFVVAFAAQGAGHVFWPFAASTTRIALAAGGGWIAVGYFGCLLYTSAFQILARAAFGALADPAPFLHQQFALLAVGLEIEGCDDVLAGQHRQCKIAELALFLRHVGLEAMLVIEHEVGPLALDDQGIERGEDVDQLRSLSLIHIWRRSNISAMCRSTPST